MRGLLPRSPRTTIVTRIRPADGMTLTPHSRPASGEVAIANPYRGLHRLPESAERAGQAAPHHRAVEAPRRVALVAGGTAGHVYPALEVGRAYQRTVPGTSVLFIGASGGFEGRLVPALG